MKLFDTTLQRLQSSLDIRLERQNVLSGNLANLDTPGYMPRDLDFTQALAAAETPRGGPEQPAAVSAPPQEGFIALDSAGPLTSAPGSFVKVTEGRGGLDGNGVDLDKTMVELSRNALVYGAAARAAGKKLAILRYVATDGVG